MFYGVRKNEYKKRPFITTHPLPSSNSNQPYPVRDITVTPSPIHQTSESQKSLSSIQNDTTLDSLTVNTNKEENHRSIKYTQTINKIKQILNTLQKNLLNKSISKPKTTNISFPSTQITPLDILQTSTQIDRSISTTMTSDSLISNTSIQTTYSVSSTLPIFNKNISQLSYRKSTVNVENEILQIELDSLNNNHYLNRIKVLNSAKNINRNQQTSEEDETKNILNCIRSRPKKSVPRRVTTVQYMSPSFMFILQILIVTCLISRFLMYYFCGIVPTDILAFIIDNSQSIIPISSTLISETEQTTDEDIFYSFVSPVFKLVKKFLVT